MKPEPMICSICGETTDWEWDEEEWILEGEWWEDPRLGKKLGYLDSVHCWRKASKEIL